MSVKKAIEKLSEKNKFIHSISESNPILDRNGVDSRTLENYEEQLGFELSDELKELYTYSNGSLFEDESQLFLLSHAFNSIEKSMRDYFDLTRLNETADPYMFKESMQDRLYKEYYFNFKLGAIKHTEFHRKWFPLGSIRGLSTHIFIDHSPGENGVHGQVIFTDFGRKAIVLADSLESYIRKITKHARYVHKEEDDYRAMYRVATDSVIKSTLYSLRLK